ncbi:cysteine proteinase [Wolfiporia cocos MD-104 SS10]|uniref:ubiquitinyl hydrolase 1 n=1 Tax=Wolfiporia cocos (strain MD-104) TaxID=742152 RepID=A0A2H3JM97_WOLCO|nr:cysteine proteinase [Wolfiporia cocos MD-104 SS10]
MPDTPESYDVPPISVSPEAPKLKISDLPDVGEADVNGRPPSYTTAEDAELFSLPPSDLDSLTPLQTYEMNENFLSESVPDRPLIAPLAPMATLRTEYEGGSQLFVKQIDWLTKYGYAGIRRTRGDGDCFYRSLAFAYIESILLASDKALAVTSAISVLESTQSLLEQAGFDRMAFEDFYDCFVNLIKRVITPDNAGQLLSSSMLLEEFNMPEVSNSVVVYLRLLTSAHIRADPDSYIPFLLDPDTGELNDLQQFCISQVEAMGKEADHVQIIALSRVLKVNITVAYLDGRPHNSQEGKVDFLEFHNADIPGMNPVILLYRPGHYDILDKRNEEPLE